MPEARELFDTRGDYLDAIDELLSVATREICIFDRDLRELEFETRSRAEALERFLTGSRDRKIRIILHDLDHLLRYSPRMMKLLKLHSHACDVRQTPDSLRHLADSFLLNDNMNGVIRFHADYFRGKKLLNNPGEISDWQKRFEDLWLESLPGATATQLGL